MPPLLFLALMLGLLFFSAPLTGLRASQGPLQPDRLGETTKGRQGPRPQFPVLLIKIKTAGCYALFCQGRQHRLSSSSDLESSFRSFPSPVTFLLSKFSAMKGHIDSWGCYLVEGPFPRGASEIRRLISPHVRGDAKAF